MTRRLLLLWIALAGGFFLSSASAQQSSPASPAGQVYRVRYGEEEAVPLTPKVIDGALTHLLAKLPEVKLKSGPLDPEGLSKALRDGLQGWKPPGKLKLQSGAQCKVVDPRDQGGYWAAPDILFAASGSREYPLQKKLDVDEKKFGLSGPPTAQLVYKLSHTVFDEDRDRPFRRNVRLRGDYYLLLTVAVTFDAQATVDGARKTLTGVSSGDMETHSFAGTVSWTDSPDAKQ